MAKNKTRQKKHSYFKAVMIAVIALLFIGAVAGCVIGWLQVANLQTKLETLMQTEAKADTASTSNIGKTSGLITPDSATAYSVGTECTILPEGARNIQVGDDLSSALLYIDYPNLAVPRGTYLKTSEGYYIYTENFSGQCFGYGKNTMSSVQFYFVSTGGGNTWINAVYPNTPKPITAYELPEDFGVVTEIDTSKPEHTALYIVEGGHSGGEEETPKYTVTDTSPLPGHGFECGAVFYLNNDVKSYADGYLCINVKALKPLMSQAGTVTIMTVSSQNGLKIENGELNYVYMGMNASGTGAEQKTLKICDGSTVSDYVYVEIDLQNVSALNEEYVTASTMRYLTDTAHVHLTTETEFPIEGCTADCVMQLKDRMKYSEGYIVIKPGALKTFAETYSGKLFYTDNHNYNYFEIENGELKYSQYLGGTERNSMTVYGADLDAETVYVHLTSMEFELANNVNTGYSTAIIGYLTTEHKDYTLPEKPEKEGYNFVGWYYGTEAEHGEACRQYEGEHITTDTSFHAHFAIKTFTVTYDTNGVGEIAPVTADWNTRAPIPTINRTGYTLAGWYLPDGTEYTGQAIKSDITLKAEWVLKVFTVTFYVEGKAVKSIDVTYGTQLTEASESVRITIDKIISASYVNEQISGVELTEMLVVDDMKVEFTLTTQMDNVMSVLQQYQILFIVCAVIVSAGVITLAVYVTKKRNSRR